MRACVAEHGGREVKALGDGFMVVFASVRRALACAVTVQRAVDEEVWKSPDSAVRVRIGLNTGEVVDEGGDLYGQAVNAAARIAARAQAGEILVSEVTRQLAGSGPEMSFRDRGRVRLKGFPERWHLYGLAWEPKERPGPSPARAGRTPYVGREAEQTELRRLLDAAVRGDGGLVMIGGEPGVGKTRLAEELLAEAIAADLQVFVGHSYEMEGAAPYVAFVEILETALARAPSPQAFRQALGEEASEIAKLLPKLRRLCPDIPPAFELPAEQERRLLFNSIAEVIARAAGSRPLLLVLDDLQWADDPTLLLVEHLAERMRDLPVLIVATYRDTEVDVGRPLAGTFEALRRRHLAHWMTLRRLPEEFVAELLGALAGQEAPRHLVRAVFSETEGNPFFVEEVYRYLAEEGRLFDAQGGFRTDLEIGELDVPAGVRLVVGRRLARLAEDVQRVLATAAVAGRAFSFELLETMGESDPDALLDAIESAQRARLITPAPDPSGEDRFVFAHELIRQTLVADLSLTRRRRLHARVADAIERHYAAPLDEHAAAIAHHLTQAEGEPARVFGYLVRAGRWAMAGAAFEEALRHYESALLRRDAAGAADRAELLSELGTAYRSTGRLDAAIGAWREAVDTYEDLGDEEGMGRVCLAASYNLAWLARFEEATEMSQRGLTALADRVSADRARLLGGAGFIAGWGGHYQAGADMIEEELRLASVLGDDQVLGHGLMCNALCRMSHLEHHVTVADGLRSAGLLRAAGDLWNVAAVLGFVQQSLMYLGRFDESRSVEEELGPLAERLGNYGAILQYRRAGAQVRFFAGGDIDEFEGYVLADRDFCAETGLPWIATSWGFLGQAQFLRGNWDEAQSLFEEAVRLEVPNAPDGWNVCLLMECLAYRGDRDHTLALLDGRDLPALGEPKLWGSACMLVVSPEALMLLDERDRAAATYRAIVDCIDRTGVVLVTFNDGRLIQRAAGIAALAGRDFEVAEAHFRTALEQAATIPHRIEEAHTRRWYGQMLLERGRSGDRDEAETVLTAAIEDYERMGMPRHRDLAEALLRS